MTKSKTATKKTPPKPEAKSRAPMAKTNFMPTGPRRNKPKESKMNTATERTEFHPAGGDPKKKEKKAKEPKAPRTPREKGPRISTKNKELLEKKIKILAEENPRRKDSATYKIFELYRNGDTVAKFVEKGGRLIDVKADVERKHIELVDA